MFRSILDSAFKDRNSSPLYPGPRNSPGGRAIVHGFPSLTDVRNRAGMSKIMQLEIGVPDANVALPSSDFVEGIEGLFKD